MTMREWFKDFGDAGETPSLVSLVLFAAVFLPAIFLAGSLGPMFDRVREAIAGLSTEWQMAGLTVLILGLMALARIVSLLIGSDARRDRS